MKVGLKQRGYRREGVACGVRISPTFRSADAVHGMDSLNGLVADLMNHPSIDPDVVIREMDKWMVTRPIRAQVEAAIQDPAAWE
jgi:hypothetical protein